ncbi:helix-turn-helix transcriptional regulator [Stomatohabitans albus]|uniref:helix-turn-helix transcriptional regulator n=1 Tax=Stomatohabitans albus TaxID=3110766 RepID=UPI00300D8219
MRKSVVGILGPAKGRVVDHLYEAALTAAELAEILDISATAVRAQLRELSAEGLVKGQVRHDGKMGRPSEEWTLTETGFRLFQEHVPTIAANLVQHFTDTHGQQETNALLSSYIRSEMAEYEEEITAIHDPRERAKRIAELMTQNGKPTQVIETEEGLKLRHRHCAWADVARSNATMCSVERDELSRLLQIDFDYTTTIADGDLMCECNFKLED